MTAEEFLERAASQIPITIEREVSIAGPAALELLERNPPVTLKEFIEHPDRTSEMRTFRYGHLIGAGVLPIELARWQERFARFRLPDDLGRLLLRANGIQLWADLDTRHSYFRLLPLDQWSDVALAPLADVFETVPPAALVISDADDFAGFAVLDTTGPEYIWCDPIAGPERIGSSVDDLLTYWWRYCSLEP